MAKSIGGTIVVALTLVMLPGTATAQSAVEGRVTRLESEMRAVQRKVFPGGSGQLVTPDIVPPDAAPATLGTPAGSAIGDLTSRVDALEGQQQTLTGQVEQLQYRTRQLEDAFAAYKKTTDARLQALEDGRASVGTAAPPPRDASSGGAPARSSAPVTDDAPASGEAVDAPSTGDPAEDAYLLGYRLWSAHRYADAATQLKTVVAKYPKSRRASYAQNLLGRSYLDDGKFNLAATTFYDNYKKMPDGERAPDSLYFLAQSLTELKKPADACKVYDELGDVYAAKLGADLKAKVATGRAAAKCQ